MEKPFRLLQEIHMLLNTIEARVPEDTLLI